MIDEVDHLYDKSFDVFGEGDDFLRVDVQFSVHSDEEVVQPDA